MNLRYCNRGLFHRIFTGALLILIPALSSLLLIRRLVEEQLRH